MGKLERLGRGRVSIQHGDPGPHPAQRRAAVGQRARGDDHQPLPWPSDRIQAVAYAVLLEEALGEPVPQARIRYHADNVTLTAIPEPSTSAAIVGAFGLGLALWRRRRTARTHF